MRTATRWESWEAFRRSERITVEIPGGGDLASALFYPADYSVGMANLGYHYIFRGLREMGVAVERFFAGPIPHRSVDRDTLLERFSIFLGSVSYEADILTFARWLNAGGIAPSRLARPEGALVGAGGAMTYINPLSLTGICDFILLGDGLPVLPYLVETLRANATKEGTLRRLAEHPSILVPSLHIDSGISRKLRVCRDEDISRAYGHGSWVARQAAFGNTLLVELQRGCARGCRYCTLPCFSPVRQRPAELVMEDVKRTLREVDFDRVGLVTPEAGDYNGLDTLLEGLEGERVGVSFASLRVDRLNGKMIRAMNRGGRNGITIAPESGSDSLRASCGKNFGNDGILSTLQMAREEGVTKVKLYFMIGLPGETEDDVLAIASLCGRIRKETGMTLTITVAPFVPKPGTAWQDAPFADDASLKSRYALLAKACKNVCRGTARGVSVREARLEYALTWGDSKLALRIASLESPRNLVRDVDRKRVRRELGELGIYQASR